VNNDAQCRRGVGKKVKAKKCEHVFVIEPLPTGKIEKPAANEKPASKIANPASKMRRAGQQV